MVDPITTPAIRYVSSDGHLIVRVLREAEPPFQTGRRVPQHPARDGGWMFGLVERNARSVPLISEMP